MGEFLGKYRLKQLVHVVGLFFGSVWVWPRCLSGAMPL